MGLLIALPIAAAIALLNKRKIEEFLFLSIGIIILPITLTGIVGNTVFGVIISVLMGIGSLVYCIKMYHKDRYQLSKYVITPGLFGSIICFILLWGIRGMYDLGPEGDLYKFYVVQVLNMYKYSNIGGIGPGSVNKALLYNMPVHTIWCYFNNMLISGYSDAVNIWARNVFIISALTPLYAVVKKRNNWKKMLIITFIIMILPYCVMNMYDFMNDVPLAAAASYATIMIIKLYKSKEKHEIYNKGYLIAASWGLMATCLIKRAGSLFIFGCVCIATVYTLDYIFNKNNRDKLCHKLFPLILLFLTAVLTVILNIYRYVYYDKSLVNLLFPIISFVLFVVVGSIAYLLKYLFKRKKIIMATILLLFSGTVWVCIMFLLGVHSTSRMYAKEITVKFWNEWIHNSRFDGLVELVDPLVILLFFIIMVYAYVKEKEENNKNTIINLVISLILGNLVVDAVFLYLYISTISPSNSDMILMMHRYFGPGILPILLTLIYKLVDINKDNFNQLFYVLCGIIALIPINPFRNIITYDSNRFNNYAEMLKDANIKLDINDNVLYLSEEHYGDYVTIPAASTREKAAYDGSLDRQEWEQRIIENGYNILLIETYGHNFCNAYGDMFIGGEESIKEYGAYNIVIEGDTVKFLLMNY